MRDENESKRRGRRKEKERREGEAARPNVTGIASRTSRLRLGEANVTAWLRVRCL